MSSERIDWDFARTVASKISKKVETSEAYMSDSIHDDFIQMTGQAEQLVAAETGLSPKSNAKAKVINRLDWVDANLASFDRLLKPLLEKMEKPAKEVKDFSDTEIGKFLGPLAETADPVVKAVKEVLSDLGPKTAGAEVGALLGYMSGRVLGQYDLLITEDENPQDQDWVYYVGPNILSMEHHFGFPPKEFRLWIAIHECTHRAQFMGVSWLRPYFLSMVDDLLGSVDTDPKQFLETLKKSKEANSQDDLGGGLAMKLANPEQKKIINRLTGLMSLLEGHGDIIMDRAGKDLIPSQPRFAKVMSQRRKNASGIAKFVQKITGMDAKMAQYEEGERFVKAVESHGGRQLFDMVWSSPEALPTLEEIREPKLWIERVS